MTNKQSLILVIAGAVILATVLFNSHQPAGLGVASPTTSAKDARIVQMYSKFKAKYGKLRASPSEDVYRLHVFAKNVELIDQANKEALGKTIFAVNDFADMQQDEIKARYFGLKAGLDKEENEIQPNARRVLNEIKKPNLGQEAVEERDWSVEEGMLPPYHQKACASCYAFAANTAMEHLYYQRHKQNIRLSIQEVVDCSTDYGNMGCLGGWMHQVFDYVIAKKGMYTDEQYPYLAMDAEVCQKISGKRTTGLLDSYLRLTKHSSTEIKEFVGYVGLVTVGIDISKLLFYSEGVYENEKCPTAINHAVVIVGYGTDKQTGTKFWKIRNSWGDDWGDKGYFKLSRHDKDGVPEICGITQYVVAPIYNIPA